MTADEIAAVCLGFDVPGVDGGLPVLLGGFGDESSWFDDLAREWAAEALKMEVNLASPVV